MSKENWIFLDMETMGQCDDALVLSIGLIYMKESYKTLDFTSRMKYGLHIKLNRQEQLPERIVDKNTILWWKSQGDSAKEVLSNDNCYHVYDAYKIICLYLQKNNYDPKTDIIWSRGMIDQRWWGSLINKTFCKFGPVEDIMPFWRWRDTRTACDILTGDPNGLPIDEPKDFIKHNALCDSVMDSIRMTKALEIYE